MRLKGALCPRTLFVDCIEPTVSTVSANHDQDQSSPSSWNCLLRPRLQGSGGSAVLREGSQALRVEGEVEFLLKEEEWSICNTAVNRARKPSWQNPYAERVIGSFRRECTDHIIALGEQHLLSTLLDY